MDDIWQLIAEMGVELHPDHIGSISTRIVALDSPFDFAKIKSGLGNKSDQGFINRLESEWLKMPHIKPVEVAAALRGASGTAMLIEKREAIEMVWTGPFTGLVASRHTEQVLLEVVASAKSRLFIVSFVAYNIETLMQSLRKAIERKVQIDILLESSTNHGGKVSIDSVEAFMKKIPSASIYVWSSKAKAKDKWDGAVHAKCAVADGKLAFITSANFTMAAMERNMELGVLVRGGNLPDKLHKHLDALVTTGIIEKV